MKNYIIILINKDIRVINDLIKKTENISGLDSYIKPSGTMRFSGFPELDTYFGFIERIEYTIEVDIISKAKRLYSLYNKNLNGYGLNDDKKRIPAEREAVISYMNKRVNELIALKEEVSNLDK